VVGNDFHRLLLAHEDPATLVLLVLEDPDQPHAALVPGFVARPLLEERFVEDEQLGALRVDDFLHVTYKRRNREDYVRSGREITAAAPS